MGKSAVKSVQEVLATPRSCDVPNGHAIPANADNSATFKAHDELDDGHPIPMRRKLPRRAFLDGNFARRKHVVEPSEYCIWDTELPGFGLRVYPTGRAHWFVRVLHRSTQRRVTFGRADELDAAIARTQAKRILAEVALDGLPKRVVAKSTSQLRDFVETHWTDIARYWKPSTAARNRNAWRLDVAPVLGTMHVADIARTDIIRWRDACAGADESKFNRALPVLASLLKYAEQLHFRRKGSNPCRRISRYKRKPCERYLSPLEYRRLGLALRVAEDANLEEVSIIRLLVYTGARVSEIRDLKWEWVRPPHLALPDSKTGAKTIWLNSQALAILDAVPHRDGCSYVFPNRSGDAPLRIGNWWHAFRRTCSLPDVRIHDLRHSFASTAIMANVPLATIGKLLGHLLPETTAKYAHLSDDIIADAAQRISGSLAEAIGLRA